MRSFILNKLIRDRVLTSMQELGQQVTYHRLDDKDFLPELKRKLLEEANELNLADKDIGKELADLLEVIDQIRFELKIEPKALVKLQRELREKRGSFNDKIYVERVDMADEDPWAAYYAKEPERFPEVKSKMVNQEVKRRP
jgi:predicted house-cleaning noncanonical NTP pyrophosphatase (MazG superfamily)